MKKIIIIGGCFIVAIMAGMLYFSEFFFSKRSLLEDSHKKLMQSISNLKIPAIDYEVESKQFDSMTTVVLGKDYIFINNSPFLLANQKYINEITNENTLTMLIEEKISLPDIYTAKGREQSVNYDNDKSDFSNSIEKIFNKTREFEKLVSNHKKEKIDSEGALVFYVEKEISIDQLYLIFRHINNYYQEVALVVQGKSGKIFLPLRSSIPFRPPLSLINLPNDKKEFKKVKDKLCQNLMITFSDKGVTDRFLMPVFKGKKPVMSNLKIDKLLKNKKRPSCPSLDLFKLKHGKSCIYNYDYVDCSCLLNDDKSCNSFDLVHSVIDYSGNRINIEYGKQCEIMHLIDILLESPNKCNGFNIGYKSNMNLNDIADIMFYIIYIHNVEFVFLTGSW